MECFWSLSYCRCCLRFDIVSLNISAWIGAIFDLVDVAFFPLDISIVIIFHVTPRPGLVASRISAIIMIFWKMNKANFNFTNAQLIHPFPIGSLSKTSLKRFLMIFSVYLFESSSQRRHHFPDLVQLRFPSYQHSPGIEGLFYRLTVVTLELVSYWQSQFIVVNYNFW